MSHEKLYKIHALMSIKVYRKVAMSIYFCVAYAAFRKLSGFRGSPRWVAKTEMLATWAFLENSYRISANQELTAETVAHLALGEVSTCRSVLNILRQEEYVKTCRLFFSLQEETNIFTL